MTRRKYEIKENTCEMCNKLFETINGKPHQRFCGSPKRRGTCSYLNKLRLITVLARNHYRKKNNVPVTKYRL